MRAARREEAQTVGDRGPVVFRDADVDRGSGRGSSCAHGLAPFESEATGKAQAMAIATAVATFAELRPIAWAPRSSDSELSVA